MYWPRVLRAKWPLTAVPCDQYVFVQPRVISVHSYYLTSWLPPHSADWRFFDLIFIPCSLLLSRLSLYAGCSWRMELVSIDQPSCRFFWNSGICYLLITLNNSTSLLLFRKNGGRKSFFMKGAFLLWLYIITTFSHFQAAMLYNLSNFHLYKMQISVIITNITVDDSSRLC